MNPPKSAFLVSNPLIEAHTKNASAFKTPPFAQDFCSKSVGVASAPSTEPGERFGISPGGISPVGKHCAEMSLRRLRAFFPKAKGDEMEEMQVSDGTSANSIGSLVSGYDDAKKLLLVSILEEELSNDWNMFSKLFPLLNSSGPRRAFEEDGSGSNNSALAAMIATHRRSIR